MVVKINIFNLTDLYGWVIFTAYIVQLMHQQCSYFPSSLDPSAQTQTSQIREFINHHQSVSDFNK